MLFRAAVFALLLLLPVVAPAQDLDRAVSALVRISGTRGGTPVRGSGFVVGLEGDKAAIVTASHVIEGVEQLSVSFAADPSESFPAGGVYGMDAGNPRGLAVFQVRGALPAGVTVLSFDGESRPALNAALVLLGFPQRALTPRTFQRGLSGRDGAMLLIDGGVGEGLSGGPVLLRGKVVGVVVETEDLTTSAVNAVVARETVVGWVKLGGETGREVASTVPQTRPAPPPAVPCVAGKDTEEINGMTFVRICGGTFTMGSAASDQRAASDERPAHQVSLSEFWIGRTEVTNEQYRWVRSDHKGDAKLPATNVNWEEAKTACEHFGGRLPTEAEWEYAARAGSLTAWSFGDDETKLGEHAWFDRNANGAWHPVAEKRPNAWGLHDLYGSVREWVGDWYADSYPSAPQEDPPGPKDGTYRVLRGGSLVDSLRELRSAGRGRFLPRDRYWDFGFRCVRSFRRQP